MADPTAGRAVTGFGRAPPATRRPEPANLADILERVLDKGIVIAGDIQVNLLDIELLTIKLRLVIASVDRAKEMGIDWWEHDPTLSSGRRDMIEENRRLRDRVAALEAGAETGARADPDADTDEMSSRHGRGREGGERSDRRERSDPGERSEPGEWSDRRGERRRE